MRFPLEKYKYLIQAREDGVKEISASTTYAGKTVKAVAKCNPIDSFSEEYGKDLAAARCNLKVSKKRVKNAIKSYDKACKDYAKVVKRMSDMMAYIDDAEKDLLDAEKFLENVIHKNN